MFEKATLLIADATLLLESVISIMVLSLGKMLVDWPELTVTDAPKSARACPAIKKENKKITRK